MQPDTSHRYGVLRRVVKLCAVLLVAGLPFAGRAAAPDGTLQVVALGDSLTAGYGLESGQSFAAKLETALMATMQDADVVERWKVLGQSPIGSSTSEYAAIIESEAARWKALAKATNTKLD